MPTYSYLCDPCDERVELFRTVSKRDDLVACPSCGDAMEKGIDIPMPPHFGLPGQGQGIQYADGSGMSTKVRKKRE